MKVSIIIIILLFIIPTYKWSNNIIKKPYKPSKSNLSILENEILHEINNYRLKLNLNFIKSDKLLKNFPNSRIKEILLKDGFNHNKFKNVKTKIFNKGGLSIGEIIGKEFMTPKLAIDYYIKIKKYKKLIEYENFTHIGIKVIKKRNKYYNVLIFSEFT